MLPRSIKDGGSPDLICNEVSLEVFQQAHCSEVCAALSRQAPTESSMQAEG